MTNQEFIELVSAMRSLQKQYFKSRDKAVLKECILIEKQVQNEIIQFTENHDEKLLYTTAAMMMIQQRYFKSRTMEILRKSKAAELAVDKALQEFQSTSKQTLLF